MKHIFDDLCGQISKATTKKYSTSFSLGILAIGSGIRKDIYAIYGFVRLADEIVDSFHGHDKAGLMARLRQETFEAISNKISINPIIHSFQMSVNRYKIPLHLIDTFLKSMEMDLKKTEYDFEQYKEYILGSAEVVGLMCLQVFVHGDVRLYEALKPSAMKLGSAFQKVNFLRDLKDDYQVLGRTYFPEVDMNRFDQTSKRQIENEIEQEFHEALEGIKKLPPQSKFGVYLAYVYYKSLFSKIKRLEAEAILNSRVRIHNGRKLSLMMSSYVQYKMQRI